MRRIRNMEQMYAQFTAEIWDSLSLDEITATELVYKRKRKKINA